MYSSLSGTSARHQVERSSVASSTFPRVSCPISPASYSAALWTTVHRDGTDEPNQNFWARNELVSDKKANKTGQRSNRIKADLIFGPDRRITPTRAAGESGGQSSAVLPPIIIINSPHIFLAPVSAYKAKAKCKNHQLVELISSERITPPDVSTPSDFGLSLYTLV